MRSAVLGYPPAAPGGLLPAEIAITTDAPSKALSLAMAALRRHLTLDAVDFRATNIAETESSREMLAALAGLSETYSAALAGYAVAGPANDDRTGGELQRVCRYAMMLTAVVAPDHVGDPQFAYGFVLHDIGKLTMPASVLMNLGDYTDAELELMKQHPEAGRRVLEDVPFLADACQIIHAHHERWDGKGYPRRLSGDEIPLGARILHLCDAFNAMTKDRPRHKAFSITDARGEIHRGRGSQFWPRAVDCFLSLSDDELEAVGGVYRVEPRPQRPARLLTPAPPGTSSVASPSPPPDRRRASKGRFLSPYR